MSKEAGKNESSVKRPFNFVHGESIISKAKEVKLDPSLLYEAVIDLSSDGLLTANSINLAAGILLKDLGLPSYFFQNITKESLESILKSIATSLKKSQEDDKVTLSGVVSQVHFDVSKGGGIQWVRIATEGTKESMESVLGPIISGHRREYYYSPNSKYYTYVVRPESVKDYKRKILKSPNSCLVFLLTILRLLKLPESVMKNFL